MRIVKTIIWSVVLIALLLFSISNWTTVEVKIWEGLVLQTKLPALVIIAFFLGLVPMWLLSKAGRWRMSRRISALESAAQSAALSLSSTRLEEAERSHSETTKTDGNS